MNIEAKLGRNVFKPAPESHIAIRHEVCQSQCKRRPCLRVCPAGVYSWNEQRQQIHVEFEGCLECGTCLIVCEHDALQWQ